MGFFIHSNTHYFYIIGLLKIVLSYFSDTRYLPLFFIVILFLLLSFKKGNTLFGKFTAL